MPQGDSFSPLAMLALLVAPTAAVSAECPLVRQTLFVDDRALTSPDTGALTQAVSLWERWSSALGLSENRTKLALLPRRRTRSRLLPGPALL